MLLSRIDAVLERYLGVPKRELIPPPPRPNVDALLKVQLALLDLPSDTKLDMRLYGTSPEQPSCILGHYAVRTDLQDVYSGLMWVVGDPFGSGSVRRVFPQWKATGTPDGHIYPRTRQHFQLSYEQLEQLFGPYGCLGATTPIDAANYMHRFMQELS